MLDVGGGVGTLLAPVLTAHQHLTGTLLDLPEVTALAERAVTGGPLASRLVGYPADAFAGDLPAGHDAILVAHFLHLFPPERNVALLRRLRQAAAAGARLLLVDWWRDPDHPHPATTFGAGEFLMISGGDSYRPDEVAGWLAESGWRLTGERPLVPPSALLIAEPTETP